MNTKIKFLGYREDENWNHYAWDVSINGTVFSYRTGIGHRTDYTSRNGMPNKKPSNSIACTESKAWAHIPNIDDVLSCLFSDSEAGQESFSDFCSNWGYSDDSLKALDTYRACLEIREKLRKALGKDFETERKRIQEKESA